MLIETVYAICFRAAIGDDDRRPLGGNVGNPSFQWPISPDFVLGRGHSQSQAVIEYGSGDFVLRRD
jgi:hypothetical protein